MTSILNRLDALEAANQANAGSFADVAQLKTEVSSLTDKVSAAPTKDDFGALSTTVSNVASDVATIKTQIGPDPVQQPVDNGGGEQQ